MWRKTWQLGGLLLGLMGSVCAIWLHRQSSIHLLALRPGPQVGLEYSVLDRGKVNINLANQEQLEQLPNIGPKLAEAIVRYRDLHGPFAYPEHLIEVPGVSEGMMETLLDFIAV